LIYRFGDAYENLLDSVTTWTAANRIASPAVDRVASYVIGGFGIPQDTPPGVRSARASRPLPFQADPFRETVDEFLTRARRHYSDVRKAFERQGFRLRPVKRERDHFRFLAAHLVGGFSWEQIARGETSLGLAVKSSKTVAGEARKAAALAGIALTTKPGPRSGSRSPRRYRRRS
jgi:hypothetical protein